MIYIQVSIVILINVIILRFADGFCQIHCNCIEGNFSICYAYGATHENSSYETKPINLSNETKPINISVNLEHLSNPCEFNLDTNISALVPFVTECGNSKADFLLLKTWFPHLTSLKKINDAEECVYKVFNKTKVDNCSADCIESADFLHLCLCKICIPSSTAKIENFYKNKTKSPDKSVMQLKWGFPLVITTASLSILAILINLIFLLRICLYKPVNLINTLGFFLMMFSILLACYGIIMSVYLYKGWSSEMHFCQGLTSLKLFSLGACICSLVMLSFHFSLRQSSTETGERDAVFKGVVFVLEGVMLSGVFSIMSWVKMDDWDFLCCIITPTSNMDKVLMLVETSYYAILFLVVAKYLFHLFRRKKNDCPFFMEHYYEVESSLFALIFFSFFIWVAGYTVTLPFFNLFSFKLTAVIRVCVLMIPLNLHTLIFNLTTSCKDKNIKITKSVYGENDALTECDCFGTGTCQSCKSNYSIDLKLDDNISNQETMLLSTECLSNNTPLQEELQSNQLINKKNNFVSPKLVCRSPTARRFFSESKNCTITNDFKTETILLQEKDENNSCVSDNIKPQKPTFLDLNEVNTTDLALIPVVKLNSPRGKPTDFPSFISIDDTTPDRAMKMCFDGTKSKFERKSIVKDSPTS
ncbi:uncharacterized protein LOC105844339 isoform X1 [Hydra vulgaris]|uniref:uncharacterized protein LOC105844339 isoform X1 n=1 Tax=Hydra vulgaris TaxID=6087 RepID=UPI001F5F05E1|nr:uncharacterized protein LOC105844339 [Hydra vulgaris]